MTGEAIPTIVGSSVQPLPEFQDWFLVVHRWAHSGDWHSFGHLKKTPIEAWESVRYSIDPGMDVRIVKVTLPVISIS